MYLVFAVVFPLSVVQTLAILSACGALFTKIIHFLHTVRIVCQLKETGRTRTLPITLLQRETPVVYSLDSKHGKVLK